MHTNYMTFCNVYLIYDWTFQFPNDFVQIAKVSWKIIMIRCCFIVMQDSIKNRECDKKKRLEFFIIYRTKK